MTRKELVENLGTIAKSGTQSFLEAVGKGADVNLIGQFGVGFYSSFLVADRVAVHSKHNDDQQYIWESDGSDTFTVRKDPEGNTLGRGTKVVLHVKEDESAYLDPQKIKDLATRYSEFVDTPVFVKVNVTHHVTRPRPAAAADKEAAIPAAEAEVPTADATPTPTDEEVSAETANEEEVPAAESNEPETEEFDEVVWEYQQINPDKPIWLRNPKDVSEDEYIKFYKAITKETTDPIAHIHFKGENSEVNFRAILFTPGTAPTSPLELMDKNRHIKLFVRRVLIADEFEDFLPRYLNFIRGVVDSDDLPLNVSREMLQQSSLLRTIAKRLVRKIIEMFSQIAKREGLSGAEDYRRFYKLFGKNLKIGVIEDAANKFRLAKLLRFESTKSNGELIGLDQYIERMRPGQKDIFFVPAENAEAARRSPFVEAARRRGIEVLFFTDPMDEYLTNVLPKYENHKFVSVTKEGLSFVDEDELVKERAKQLREHYEPLTHWLRHLLGDRVERVIVSSRLREPTEAPCVVTNTANSISATMERIMRAQATVDERFTPQTAKKVLEINPAHPLIRGMLKIVKADPQEESAAIVEAKKAARLMADTALIEAGFLMDDMPAFIQRVYDAIKSATPLPPPAPEDDVDLAPVPEPPVPEDDATTAASSASTTEGDDKTKTGTEAGAPESEEKATATGAYTPAPAPSVQEEKATSPAAPDAPATDGTDFMKDDL